MRNIFYGLSVSSVLATTIFGDVNLSNGLVAHYEFEGNANDSSGNENHGTEHGGVSYVDGVIGKAGNFDGIDDTIKIEHNPQIDFTIDDNYTISLFVKYVDEDINDDSSILEKWGDILPSSYPMVLRTSNKYGVYFAIFDHYHGGTAVVDMVSSDKEETKPSIWNHIVITKVSSSYIKMFLNGRLVSIDDNFQVETIQNTNPLYIGSRGNDTESYSTSLWYKGLIDDLRIYNRALSEDEISELYNLRCFQENIYAKSPNSENWYKFENSCDVPENWETSLSDENITVQNSWTSEKVENLSSGWTLNGTANKISDSAMKNLIESKAELLNEIPQDSGFWIQK
jgi:hypothetical protein